MELKRVVVTGLGALTPVGNNVAETWENLVKGISGAGPITHFDASKFKTHFACEVKNFNGTDYIDRKELRKMDLYTQYAIAAAKEAVEDSGMDLEKEDLNRIGVIYGVGIGGIHTFEEEVANYTLNKDTVGPKFNPFFIPKMIADIASGQISIMYGFHGPNFTTTSACASSSNAIADAFNYIRLGKANVIVAGGAEAAIFEAGLGGFNAMHALSTRNDDPERASRPFSASRDGFVMGEDELHPRLGPVRHGIPIREGSRRVPGLGQGEAGAVYIAGDHGSHLLPGHRAIGGKTAVSCAIHNSFPSGPGPGHIGTIPPACRHIGKPTLATLLLRAGHPAQDGDKHSPGQTAAGLEHCGAHPIHQVIFIDIAHRLVGPMALGNIDKGVLSRRQGRARQQGQHHAQRQGCGNHSSLHKPLSSLERYNDV